MATLTVFELAQVASQHYTSTMVEADHGPSRAITHLQAVDGDVPSWIRALARSVQEGQSWDNWRAGQTALALQMMCSGFEQGIDINSCAEMFYLQAETDHEALRRWAMSSAQRQQRCCNILGSASSLQEAQAEEKMQVFFIVRDVLLIKAGLKHVDYQGF